MQRGRQIDREKAVHYNPKPNPKPDPDPDPDPDPNPNPNPKPEQHWFLIALNYSANEETLEFKGLGFF